MSSVLEKFKKSEWYDFIKDYNTVLLFIITAIAALGSVLIKSWQFIYMCGYFSFWGLPAELISIDASIYSFLLNIFTIFIYISSIFMFINTRKLCGTMQKLYKTTTAVYKISFIEKCKYICKIILTFIFNYIVVSFINYFTLLVNKPDSQYIHLIVSSLILALVQLSYSFITPFGNIKKEIMQKPKIPKKNISKPDLTIAEEDIKLIKRKFKNLIPSYLLLYTVVLIIAVSVLSFFSGYSYAEKKEEYFVEKTYNRIVVYQDDYKYILVEKNAEMEDRKFLIILPSEIGKLTIENVGKQPVKK